MKRPIGVVSVLVLVLCGAAQAQERIPRYGVYTATLPGPEDVKNPYIDVDVTVTFTGPQLAAGARTVKLPAFWDGGSTWKVRMSPEALGVWTWRTESTHKKLDRMTGNFTCVPSGSVGFWKVDATMHPRVVLRGDKPVYLMGAGAGALDVFSTTDRSFERFIDTRAAQGFNYLHFAAVVGPGDLKNKNEGGDEFVNGDADRINPAYFQAGDERVFYCNYRGMVAGIGLGGPAADLFKKLNEDQVSRLWRYVVARYAALDVIWVLFDAPGPGAPTPEQVRKYAELTAKLDPYRHPVAAYAEPDVDAAKWADIVLRHGLEDKTLKADRNLLKPVLYTRFMTENLTGKDVPGVPEVTANTDAMRQAEWVIAMNGGHFVYNALGMDASRPDTLNATGARYAQFLAGFFRQIEWSSLTSENGLLRQGRAWILAKPESEYVVYLPQGGTVGLDVSALGATTVWVQWLDPRTGRISQTSRVPAQAPLVLQAPDDKNDWVLDVFKVMR